MKKSRRFLLWACLSLTFVPAGAKSRVPARVTLSQDALMDKIRGAWAGQVIGCTYGGPTEFRYATTIDDHIDIPWSEHEIKKWYDNSPGLYDDVYMDLTFVEVFQKEGLDAPIESFARAYAHAGYPLWHANLQGRYNILHGIMPPASGHWLNNAHADDIDFQIEADYAGIMAPGMVNAASRYCDGIGHMMNYGDGWYGGVYMAAMYALAFVSDDIGYIVTEALKTIPAGTRYRTAMEDVIKWHKAYPENWRITWSLVNEKHGFDVGCPDGVFNGYNIDAVLNSAYVIIGLLYGNKNYTRTLDISCRCGADSDCNPASAGGILGTVLGFKGIPEYWKKPVGEVADRNFKYTDISLNKATRYSFEQALQVIRKNGGVVGEKDVTIQFQTPQAVRFEQSFVDHWPVSKKSYRQYVGKTRIEFEGNGVVAKYSFQKPADYREHGYEAEIEVYVDGKPAKTVKLPIGGNGMTRELCALYNLPVQKHTVTFKWLNRDDGVDIIVGDVIVYSNQLKLTKHENL